MLLKPLAFAATAAAFVLLPKISDADADILNGIVTALPVESESFGLAEILETKSVSVACPQCKGRDSHLQLDFAVEDGARLTLNGFELYPNADPWGGELTATLVKENGQEKGKSLGYSLAVEPVAMDAYQQMQLIKVELRVIEVGGQFVDGIPAVKVELIRAITEDLAISSVDVEKATEVKCATMWCRAQDLGVELAKAFESVKGCVGRQKKHKGQHKNKGEHKPGFNNSEHQQDAAHSDGPGHDGEKPHSHRHNWRLLLKNIASHIFLPVLMGITAGVGVAVLAMVLCSIAIRLTRLVRTKRTKKAGLCRKKHSSRQRAADVEKEGLIEEIEEVDAEDELPKYKDDEPKN
ncbi:hypothetical protein G6O67_002002 [Ophiocordyceps sinensis]|uniref:DUF7728 domain-containing protein n=2 Tax=Ophiocordyceps sinensis TaxID=72228 RepID=A0A8H4PTD2_9HYPO|nr:hypothetical protein OCS_03504 [Ophiocordyceps sinensis CO18]KAF4510082.1 hypothetical protein G6O67_002002 [Ophiocordyceps sinensis]